MASKNVITPILVIIFMGPTPTSMKKPFPPGAFCGIMIPCGIIGIIIIDIIYTVLLRNNSRGIGIIEVIGFLFFITMLIMCIVGFVNFKKKKRAFEMQGISSTAVPLTKLHGSERRAERKRAKIDAHERRAERKQAIKMSAYEKRAERKRAKIMAYQPVQSAYTKPGVYSPAPLPVNQPVAATVPPRPVISQSASTIPPKPVISQSASASPVVTPTKRLPDVYIPQTATTVVVPEELKRIATQIVDDIRPSGVKAKSPKKAGTHVEPDAEPLPFDEATEQEIGVQKQEFTCVVHKGPITGANFLCPTCGTFYCMKCAVALKKNGEKCWTCGADLTVELPQEE